MLSGVMAAVVGCIAVAVYGMVFGLFLQGIDRKCAAHMQARVGPPIRQPFIDIGKLLCKDNVVPDNAVRSVFNAAPLIALAASVTILLYLPVGSFMPVLGPWGDIVLIMYLLTVPALAMVAGGFASGSPYATVGSQREMVTMIAYEFPLAIAIIAIGPSYALESDGWRPVELTSDALKRLVDRIRFVAQAEYQSALRPNGARILTADGEVVGAWYSVYDYSRVRLLDGNRIAISKPLSNLPGNLPRPL